MKQLLQQFAFWLITKTTPRVDLGDITAQSKAMKEWFGIRGLTIPAHVIIGDNVQIVGYGEDSSKVGNRASEKANQEGQIFVTCALQITGFAIPDGEEVPAWASRYFPIA